MAQSAIRVVLVEDDEAVRELFPRWLTGCDDIVLAGSFACAEALLEALAGHGGVPAIELPDIVLMDLKFEGPHMDGIEAAEVLCRRYPFLKVCALSGSDDRNRIRQAFQVGMRSYFYKHGPREELPEGIREVARGRAFIGRSLSEQVFSCLREGTRFSKREREVLRLHGRGLKQSAMAVELGISVRQVERVVAQILEKTGCARLDDAARSLA